MTHSSVEEIDFKVFADANGQLSVYQSGVDVPFEIRRVFNVVSSRGEVRGNHAHKKCTQLLVCVSGMIDVTTDDGCRTKNYRLAEIGKGLLLRPMVWARQEYLSDGSVLMVLCDRPYEEEDYVRDHRDFLKLIGKKVP